MTSGELIREARRRHGLSQRSLARRAGASQAWISRLERGEISPSVDSLERLLFVMGEGLQMESKRLQGDDDDLRWRQIQRSRPMGERLARAFDAARFASELRDSATRTR